jgi:hypothetical protein
MPIMEPSNPNVNLGKNNLLCIGSIIVFSASLGALDPPRGSSPGCKHSGSLFKPALNHVRVRPDWLA